MSFNKLYKLWGPLTAGGAGLIVYNVQNKKFPQFQKEEFKDVISQEPYSTQVFLQLPLNALSRVWGKMSHVTLPESSRPYLYGLYARTFKCNLEEAEQPDLKSYKTFGDFFRRAINLEARPISQKSLLVSPCDGTILSSGAVSDNKVEHVKTKSYSLNYFLGPNTWDLNGETQEEKTEELKNTKAVQKVIPKLNNSIAGYGDSLKINPENSLFHCTIYLAPGDYHRFHSPAKWTCKFRRYFPGYLLSVSPKMANRIPELMNINERVVYVGKWEHGFFSMAAVGATNVGSIKVYKDPELVTNQRLKLPAMIDNNQFSVDESSLQLASIPLKKGDAFGEFNLGSTIVLVFEAPKDFKFAAQAGSKINFGDSLGN